MAASSHRISGCTAEFLNYRRRVLSKSSQLVSYRNEWKWRKKAIVVRTNCPIEVKVKVNNNNNRRKSIICGYALHDNNNKEDESDGKVVSIGVVDRRVEVAAAALLTMGLGVANRVLYKLPLKHYPFFLAQLATFGYMVVYFSILHFRYRAGIVTDEMLSMPKAPLLAVGLLEALGAACGMAAGAVLSGASIPILSQSFLVWQIILSYLFLGRRYKFNQLLGCFLVALGVIVTVASGSSAGSLMEAGLFWSLLMIVSFLFQAADTILKEVIFLDAAKKLKGGSVDLFVINSYGSAFQVG
ncbi:protein CLT1, chloroplastic-like [Bidens hawaiensis]|uniref:protein CLT1, chloroplastic-like n=1 Tax=Bidens hawaiensis TaxID=980011 RepID=UPI00404963AA